jgi:hypothetical protein
MKHPMRLCCWRQLLTTFGAMQSNSYVEVGEDLLVLSFGFFDDRLPRGTIGRANAGRWPRHGKLGWRLGLGGRLGLIGDRSGIVEIQLKRPHRARGLIAPYTYDRVYVSVCDPGSLVSELNNTGRRIAAEARLPEALF